MTCTYAATRKVKYYEGDGSGTYGILLVAKSTNLGDQPGTIIVPCYVTGPCQISLGDWVDISFTKREP
jgi:hypothetical protein